MITANDYFDAYLDGLAAGGIRACEEYQGCQSVWTIRATLALCTAGQLALSQAEIAAKGNADRYGRSEYLGLDVTLYDDNSWAPPVFIGEHENRPYEWTVQYAAWKLLSVQAQRRMLVAYFGGGNYIRTFDRLRDIVLEVCNDNPGKDILLVGGEYLGQPKNVDELRGLHQTAIVGLQNK